MKTAKSQSKQQATVPASTVAAHVGKRLRLRREQFGFEIADMATALRADVTRLEALESGTSEFDVGLLFRLSVMLDIPIAWFYDGIMESRHLPTAGTAHEQAPSSQTVPAQLTEHDERKSLLAYFEQLDPRDRAWLVQFARVMSRS